MVGGHMCGEPWEAQAEGPGDSCGLDPGSSSSGARALRSPRSPAAQAGPQPRAPGQPCRLVRTRAIRSESGPARPDVPDAPLLGPLCHRHLTRLWRVLGALGACRTGAPGSALVTRGWEARRRVVPGDLVSQGSTCHSDCDKVPGHTQPRCDLTPTHVHTHTHARTRTHGSLRIALLPPLPGPQEGGAAGPSDGAAPALLPV